MSDNTQPANARIFELLTAYHRSLDTMKAWLDESDLSDVERIGIADAWQAEMRDWFREHGFCFACNRPLARCTCESAQRVAAD